MVDFAKYDSQTNWRTKLPFPRIEDDVTKAPYLQDIMGSDPAAETKRIVAKKKTLRLVDQSSKNSNGPTPAAEAILWPLYANNMLPYFAFAMSTFFIMPAVSPGITRGGAALAGYLTAATTEYQVAYLQKAYPPEKPNTDPSVGLLKLPNK